MKKIEFKNYEDEQTTPINAQALNAIQDNVESAINNIDVSEKADITYVDSELELKANKTYVDTELGKKADKLKYIRLQLANIDVAFKSLVLNTWSVSESSGDFTSNSTSIIAPKNGLMRISASIFVRYFGSSFFQFYLTKNGVEIGRMPTTVIESGLMVLPSIIMQVNQGDVFQIKLSTNWTSGKRVGYLAGGNGISWFQAEMID